MLLTIAIAIAIAAMKATSHKLGMGGAAPGEAVASVPLTLVGFYRHKGGLLKLGKLVGTAKMYARYNTGLVLKIDE